MQDPKYKDMLKDYILSDSQLYEVYKRFCAEICKGLSKEHHDKADTKCFFTYVQDLPNGNEVGDYLALDLGGTKFRVLLVKLKGKGREPECESAIYPIPKEITVGTGIELFDHIAKCLGEFVKAQNLSEHRLLLGFTFSFPCVQVGLNKAILVKWTKGFRCSGVEGEDVGQLLTEAIERHGNLDIQCVAVINDTLGTLMSCAHNNPNCRIGLIIGTGCNACYVESVKCAERLEPEYKKTKKNIVINIEWGAFGDGGGLDFVRTDFDREIDDNSVNRRQQIYEKMISGMYLGEMVRLNLIKAIGLKLIFSEASNKGTMIDLLEKYPQSFETRFISEIDADSIPEYKNTRKIIQELLGYENPSQEDCRKLRRICEVITRRSAYLIGVTLSGLINKMNEPKVVVGIDGSVYRYHPKFDSYLRTIMRKFVNPKLDFDIMLSEDGSGQGAALVAATASSYTK